MHEPYVPRYIALAKGRGKNICEVLLVGASEPDALEKIAGVLSRHRVDVQSIYGRVDKGQKLFEMVFHLDLTTASISLQRLTKELKNLGFMRRAEGAQLDGLVYDQFLFPIYILGDQRAVLLRPDALFAVEKRLEAAFGTGGPAILFDEGREFARHAFAMIKSQLPKLGAELTKENLVDGFRAQGWGLFEFEKKNDSVEVRIRSPPVLKESPKHSRFLVGMVGGAVESLFGQRMGVKSVAYDARTDTLKLEYTKSGTKN